MRKKWILVLFLLPNIVWAKSVGLSDYGKLLSKDKFSTHCLISDPGISGSDIVSAYSNGQITCGELQKLYSVTYFDMQNFLIFKKHDFTKAPISRTLVLRVLTLAELNDPDNFSQTDSRCMYNIKCESGAFFGRTFYSDASSNINVYVTYPKQRPSSWKYSFVSSIKHELMHVILYRYGWNYPLNSKAEHALIDEFLLWRK